MSEEDINSKDAFNLGVIAGSQIHCRPSSLWLHLTELGIEIPIPLADTYSSKRIMRVKRANTGSSSALVS